MKINKKIISGLVLTTFLMQPISIYAYSKNETVFSNLNYNGSVENTLVNSHLSKLDKGNIEDYAFLSKITNLNGGEKYEKNGDKIIWNSLGEDIFYQGKTKEELPITIDINYYLNDIEMSPKKMLGKDGEVKIKINFKNNCFNEVNSLHTPFVVSTGLILDSVKNSDISITNGEIEETGTRSIALAVAAPGLYDDLKIKELESLDEVIITYKTEDFSLNNLYFVATPKILEKIDIENLNKINSLDSSISLIQENMNKIEDGANSLNDASLKLNNGSSEITNNLKVLLQAIKKLEVGSNNLDKGIQEVINSLENIKLMLENKNINGSLANIDNLTNANSNTIKVLEKTNNSLKVNYDNYNLNNFNNDNDFINYFTSIGLNQDMIKDLLTCKKTYESNLNLINLLNTNNSTLNILKKSLEEIYGNVNNMIFEFNKALIKLEAGSKEINNGLEQVSVGVDKLYNGSKILTQATSDFSSGADNLSLGISTLNTNGINKLSNSSKKLNNYSNTIKKLINLSKNYQGFSANNSTKTTFIYKVKAVK